jgi:hypothetical protein
MLQLFVDTKDSPPSPDWVHVTAYGDLKKQLWSLSRSNNRDFIISFGQTEDIDNYLSLLKRLLSDFYSQGDYVHPTAIYVHTSDIEHSEHIINTINNYLLFFDKNPLASWRSHS